MIAEWVEDFEEFTATPEEYIDANDHQVVVRVHQKAVGSQSGAPIEADFWFVHTLSDGKITRLDMFASKAQAFEAAGLPAAYDQPPAAGQLVLPGDAEIVPVDPGPALEADPAHRPAVLVADPERRLPLPQVGDLELHGPGVAADRHLAPRP